MPKVKTPTEVRHCVNAAYKTLEVTGDSEADQFLALGKWLRDHPGASVGAINIHYAADPTKYESWLVVQIDTPWISIDNVKEHYGPDGSMPHVPSGKKNW